MQSEAQQPQLMQAPSMANGAPPMMANSMPPAQQSAPQAYTPEQMDQMLAPIALYPDQLVGQILMASTYPLEIVEAQRWVKNPQNAALKGDQLQAALAQQPWDPSVKSLIPFPQVINMMDGNLQWTEQLGDAFLANQPAVMDSVQHLRQMAQNSGNLRSTPQQTVSAEQGAIIIQPPTPQTVYVPYYDPSVVYGPWPYAAYPPYYFPPPPGYVYYPGVISFGAGFIIADWLWGWDRWDWHSHRIFVDEHRWDRIEPHRAFPSDGVWAHNPADRHGVPYHSAAVRSQFGGAQAQARSNFRGFSNQSENRGAVSNAAINANTNGRPNAAQYPGASHFQQRTSAPPNVSASPNVQTQSHGVTSQATSGRNFASQQMQPSQTRNASFGGQRSSPMFESFSRGQEVHTQSARGAASRAAMSSAPRAAPSGGGNHGGGNGGGHEEHGRNR